MIVLVRPGIPGLRDADPFLVVLPGIAPVT
jgi:hypothetical protein